MLFDLRSRGRRQTVRIIYAFLALVMVVGLVGLGIGTGNSGGILNAGGNGGSGGGSAVYNQAVKKALDAVKKNPSAGNWVSLMRARFSAASTPGKNYNSTTSTYTASGKKQLQEGADAWQQYLKVTKGKQSGQNFLQTAFLAAGLYQSLGQWSNESDAWNFALGATSAGTAEALKPSLCLALSAYAAKLTSKGDLAAANAVKLTPKLQRVTLQSTFKSARSSPTDAQAALVQEGC
jgi:hypothetical protein